MHTRGGAAATKKTSTTGKDAALTDRGRRSSWVPCSRVRTTTSMEPGARFSIVGVGWPPLCELYQGSCQLFLLFEDSDQMDEVGQGGCSHLCRFHNVHTVDTKWQCAFPGVEAPLKAHELRLPFLFFLAKIFGGAAALIWQHSHCRILY